MVSQVLWLKWPHQLHTDSTKGPQMVSQAWWLKWPDHLQADGAQRATNGEPGLVVEITIQLTCWWGTKGPQMVSQALWLKWPHHLLPDGTKGWQMVSQALWLKWPHHLLLDAQGSHKWWARRCGWNDHTPYLLMWKMSRSVLAMLF